MQTKVNPTQGGGVAHWRKEHLFTLRQSLQAGRFQQQLITECEAQIHQLTEALQQQTDQAPPPGPITLLLGWAFV